MGEMHHDILIVGGGAAGLTVAARLKKADRNLRVAVIEPSTKHYYQPLWTLVGGGIVERERSERDEKDLIPDGVEWIRDAVTEFQPEKNSVLTRDGKTIRYDQLVVAPGIQVDWEKVKGLKENLGTRGICSNYSYESVNSTWEYIRNFKGGTAIFTFPNTPVKCGGAPQKIMYLAEHYFRKSGVRKESTVAFYSAGASIFAVKKYADALNRVIKRRHIETHYQSNLIELRPATREAVFESVDTKETKAVRYDMIHVTPPMSGPDFIKRSALANAAGWIDVNKETLQHVRFPNIFGLGDASSLPTSKTGAAIRKQAPVVVSNLMALRKGTVGDAQYDGYTSCPLVTGYGKLILAEFDYEGKPQETFPFDQSKERYSMYLLKKHLLPKLYWGGMLKGNA